MLEFKGDDQLRKVVDAVRSENARDIPAQIKLINLYPRKEYLPTDFDRTLRDLQIATGTSLFAVEVTSSHLHLHHLHISLFRTQQLGQFPLAPFSTGSFKLLERFSHFYLVCSLVVPRKQVTNQRPTTNQKPVTKREPVAILVQKKATGCLVYHVTILIFEIIFLVAQN